MEAEEVGDSGGEERYSMLVNISNVKGLKRIKTIPIKRGNNKKRKPHPPLLMSKLSYTILQSQMPKKKKKKRKKE
jgi:hypothetical protein